MTFDQGHALIIGVGTYQYEPQLNVPITVSDAQAVAGVLHNQQFCGYPDTQVKLLHGSTATRESILAALDQLAACTTETNTILVMYGGHGIYGSDGDYYLSTHDTRLQNHRVTTNSGISERHLLQRFAALKARRLLFVINACHSGEVSPILGAPEDQSVDAQLPEQTAKALLATGSGRVLITACREDQVSFIGDGKLSLFSQALVDGLQGKGDYVTNQRGFISVFDLYSHLYDVLQKWIPQRVSAHLRRRYGERQEPELTISKGVGSFALALYRGSTSLGEFNASDRPAVTAGLREVEEEVSRRLFGQILQAGQGHIQAGHDVNQSSNTTIKASGNVSQISGNISSGMISGSGNVIGHGSSIHIHQGAKQTGLSSLFADIYQEIEKQLHEPDAVRRHILGLVQQIEGEIIKGSEVDANRVESILMLLARLSPNICAITTNALLNADNDVSMVIRTIAANTKP